MNRNNMMRTIVFLLTSFLFFGVGLVGCQISEPETEAGQTEECRMLIDERDWDGAIDICSVIETDEAWHLTAQAYMGRAGLDLIAISGAFAADADNTSSDATAKILDYTPTGSATTATAKADYTEALRILMQEMTERDNNAWMEVLIMSTLLFFDALQATYNDGASLTVINGTVNTCYPATCAVPDFSILFYQNLCGNGVATVVAPAPRCTINSDSILSYNDQAVTNLANLGDFSQFNIKTKMDNNYTLASSCLTVGGTTGELDNDEVICYFINPGF